LARQTAMKAAKAQLRAQGRKVHHFTLRELTILAREYLDQHPELFAETWQRVKNAPELRELYDREMRDRQRKLEQNCKHLHSTRSVAAQGVSLCESQTQNGSVGDAK